MAICIGNKYTNTPSASHKTRMHSYIKLTSLPKFVILILHPQYVYNLIWCMYCIYWYDKKYINYFLVFALMMVMPIYFRIKTDTTPLPQFINISWVAHGD